MHINIEPTYRENDGLAMSSRNLRLNTKERETAAAIFKALTFLKENQQIETKALEDEAIKQLTKQGFQVDYFQIVDADTLQPTANQKKNRIALVAAFLGNVRLIDNLLLS
ncbi:MAG: hypothetical protein EOO10_24425 [Chitinophagaceae bacterium]|nr:MAG: hypothetical protein EOO10_24425 [Chitinophagaceae bacterium]